jgi:nucleotide-binding universal stress UspA family protein
VSPLKTVLLCTDFSSASQGAFQAALGVCASLQANLLILHVFEYSDAVPPETGGQLLELDRVYQSANVSLNALCTIARQQGIACESMMGSGIPAKAILDTIACKKVDLAVVATNALHGFERLVFGSTAETVLRKAPCPVLTIGPQVSDPSLMIHTQGPVVFATDFHLTTIQAICHAASFCEVTGSTLHCLHVLPRTLEGGVQSEVIPQIMTEALQQVATESGNTLNPPICAVTYGSEVSNAVIDYARLKKAKLIVLGVRQASMLSSHIPAHIAFRIITEAPCPVLTVAYPSSSLGLGALTAACL